MESLSIALAAPSFQMGKTTIANYLKDININGFRILTLAGTFKTMTKILYENIGISQRRIERYFSIAKEEIVPELGVSTRWVWQSIGSEWGRNLIHKDLWIMAACGNLNRQLNYICEDLRFISEANFFRSKGFKIVQVVNPRVKIVRNHQSEGELDDYNFDYTIINDGTLEELYLKVNVMIEELKDAN